MSQSSSRGRTATIRYKFEPDQLTPDAFTASNLEAFARVTGAKYEEELKKRLNNLKQELKEQGLSPASSQYKKALQQERYDYLVELSNSGVTIKDIPRNANGTLSTTAITAEQVKKIFDDKNGGGLALLRFIEENSADAFNTNALKSAGALLKIPKLTASTAGLTGSDLKVALRNIILNGASGVQDRISTEEDEAKALEGRYTAQSLNEKSDAELREILAGLNASQSGKKSTLITRILDQQGPLQNPVRYTPEALNGKKVDELKNILRNSGKKVSGNKKELIERILERSDTNKVPIAQVINDIIAAYNNSELTVRDVRERAARISPDDYSPATVPDLKRLVAIAGVTVTKAGSAAKKDELIQALTGQVPSSIVQQQTTRRIMSDLSACADTDTEVLMATAKDLGISTRGLSKGEICEAVHLAYLQKFSRLFLDEYGNSGDSLQELARLPEAKRTTAIRDIARRSGYRAISTLPDLLKEFLFAHWGSRTLQQRPDAYNAFVDYINNGTLPDDDAELADIAAIFADINPDILALDPDAMEDALKELYNSFILQIMNGEKNAEQLLDGKLPIVKYSPARRSRGRQATTAPLVRPSQSSNRAPRQEPAPLPMRPQSPVYYDDEDEELEV